jgi:hypothetical protein
MLLADYRQVERFVLIAQRLFDGQVDNECE